MTSSELSDASLKAAIKRATQSQKTRTKIFDSKGLYLLVEPPSSPGWRFKYYFGSKEKLLSFGTYPEITLKRAREKRDGARRLVAEGIDPSAHRQQAKAANADTLRVVYEEWLGKQKHLAESTLKRDRGRFEMYILPKLGDRPIRSIMPPDLLAELRKMEAKGIHESAARARSMSGRIWRFAIATGRAERDITVDLKGALTAPSPKSFAAITDPRKIGELMRAIDGYQGQPGTLFALKLAPLVFVRPSELRFAEWSEFDLGKDATWRIPAEKMKMDDRHIVPLSTQAVAIIEELRAITGDGKYLFPSIRTSVRCMSDNTVNAALRRLGYTGEEMVGHGFRAMASTLLNEQGWHPDVIELQLAHKERNKVRAAYNRAERLVERRKMMQAWADCLDEFRRGRADKVGNMGGRA